MEMKPNDATMYENMGTGVQKSLLLCQNVKYLGLADGSLLDEELESGTITTCDQNKTMVKEVFLLGFQGIQHFKNVIFALFLILYISAMIGNILIFSLILSSPRLNSPMYFFLCNLSFCEILFTTIVMPNMLYVLWSDGGLMTFQECISQFYLGTSTGCAECLLLTVMAYDRYLAICNPLRYSTIMDAKKCNHLAFWSWISGFLVMIIITASICKLQFCGLNTIDHLFCDLAPILQLSTTDTSLVEIETVLITITLSLIPFVLIIMSYITISFTILKISTKMGRQKTFSTCSSHLASVCTYFGAIFIIYLVPSQKCSNKINKVLSLSYTICTPLLNPVIYSFRNQEMKSCIKSYFLFKTSKFNTK
ncbi:olfactory receptor 10A7-like [Anomaloglossus baeobatrachus]|uniref:olfactory receptor 10A7-like n=1 Tax=Anomaloglossus baeobatrachus TaxID=238106 RepID=UPI003F5006C3